MKKYINIILTALIIAGLTYLLGYVMGAKKGATLPEPEVITDTIYQTDTITDIEYKYKYFHHYDTAYLASIDTLYMTDSILVEVPISNYCWDTNDLQIQASGYHVTLDTIIDTRPTLIETHIIHDTVRSWHFGFGFAIGLGWVR